MGQEKEAILLREEAQHERRQRGGHRCYICDAPADGRDPKGGGPLCGWHLEQMMRDD